MSCTITSDVNIVTERDEKMTQEQKQRIAKLERSYGTKADLVTEIVIVAFSPDSMCGVTFAIGPKGRICTAEQVGDRYMQMGE
jgi:hypothetical protein